jgi:hypothetical protein
MDVFWDIEFTTERYKLLHHQQLLVSGLTANTNYISVKNFRCRWKYFKWKYTIAVKLGFPLLKLLNIQLH